MALAPGEEVSFIREAAKQGVTIALQVIPMPHMKSKVEGVTGSSATDTHIVSLVFEWSPAGGEVDLDRHARPHFSAMARFLARTVSGRTRLY